MTSERSTLNRCIKDGDILLRVALRSVRADTLAPLACVFPHHVGSHTHGLHSARDTSSHTAPVVLYPSITTPSTPARHRLHEQGLFANEFDVASSLALTRRELFWLHDGWPLPSVQRSGAGTAAAWRKLGQWVAAGEVPEQMPEARTCGKELEHVSATRLIIAHWVLSCLTQALFLFFLGGGNQAA